MLGLGENFWTKRYQDGSTGWDLGYASPPLYQYLCQIQTKEIPILIPGAGNGYEVAAARELGFEDIHLLDISSEPIQGFLKRFPSFPSDHIHHEDFFQHHNHYDLILEQTFFCALDPVLRADYAKKIHDLLNPGGRLVGVLFDRDFSFAGPPFGGTETEYRSYFEPLFEIDTMERCYNSHPSRAGTELFINLRKSDIQD